jgi:hypothetical protein
MSSFGEQVGGDHYGDIDPFTFIDALGLGFYAGNIFKYIYRHADKNGSQDIKKAIHYCHKLQSLRNQNSTTSKHFPINGMRVIMNRDNESAFALLALLDYTDGFQPDLSDCIAHLNKIQADIYEINTKK